MGSGSLSQETKSAFKKYLDEPLKSPSSSRFTQGTGSSINVASLIFDYMDKIDQMSTTVSYDPVVSDV